MKYNLTTDKKTRNSLIQLGPHAVEPMSFASEIKWVVARTESLLLPRHVPVVSLVKSFLLSTSQVLVWRVILNPIKLHDSRPPVLGHLSPKPLHLPSLRLLHLLSFLKRSQLLLVLLLLLWPLAATKLETLSASMV
jgi:hypothetical protein